jgi:hypothetical protein
VQTALLSELLVLYRIVVLKGAELARHPPNFMLAVPPNGLLESIRKGPGRFPAKLRTDFWSVENHGLPFWLAPPFGHPRHGLNIHGLLLTSWVC